MGSTSSEPSDSMCLLPLCTGLPACIGTPCKPQREHSAVAHGCQKPYWHPTSRESNIGAFAQELTQSMCTSSCTARGPMHGHISCGHMHTAYMHASMLLTCLVLSHDHGPLQDAAPWCIRHGEFTSGLHMPVTSNAITMTHRQIRMPCGAMHVGMLSLRRPRLRPTLDAH